MRKLNSILFAVMIMMVAFVAPALAQTDFFIDAEVPASSAASFAVSQVIPGPPDDFISQAPGFVNLSFGLLTLDTVNGIFTPAHFWAIDVGQDGAGAPDIQIAYTDTNNPNGANNNGSGLGGHGTISYAEVSGPQNAQIVNAILGQSLQQANGQLIDETDFAAGFLRISIGIATGDPNLQEGDAVPFTQADQPGDYSGTLTVTATFD